jgi:hypothetical protein
MVIFFYPTSKDQDRSKGLRLVFGYGEEVYDGPGRPNWIENWFHSRRKKRCRVRLVLIEAVYSNTCYPC